MDLDKIVENKFFQKTFEILKDNYLTIGICEPFSKGNLSKIFKKLDPNGICFNGQYKGFWYEKTPEIFDEDRQIKEEYEKRIIKKTKKLASETRRKTSSLIGIAITSYRQNDYDTIVGNDIHSPKALHQDKFYIAISYMDEEVKIVKSQWFNAVLREDIIDVVMNQLFLHLYNMFRSYIE